MKSSVERMALKSPNISQGRQILLISAKVNHRSLWEETIWELYTTVRIQDPLVEVITRLSDMRVAAIGVINPGNGTKGQ